MAGELRGDAKFVRPKSLLRGRGVIEKRVLWFVFVHFTLFWCQFDSRSVQVVEGYGSFLQTSHHTVQNREAADKGVLSLSTMLHDELEQKDAISISCQDDANMLEESSKKAFSVHEELQHRLSDIEQQVEEATNELELNLVDTFDNNVGSSDDDLICGTKGKYEARAQLMKAKQNLKVIETILATTDCKTAQTSLLQKFKPHFAALNQCCEGTVLLQLFSSKRFINSYHRRHTNYHQHHQHDEKNVELIRRGEKHHVLKKKLRQILHERHHHRHHEWHAVATRWSSHLDNDAGSNSTNSTAVIPPPHIHGVGGVASGVASTGGTDCVPCHQHIGSDANCHSIVSAVGALEGDARQAVVNAQRALNTLEEDCANGREEAGDAAHRARELRSAAGAALASALKSEKETKISLKLAWEVLKSKQHSLFSKRTQCEHEMVEREANMCGLRKLRMQLLQKLSATALDCEVSEWRAASECSVTCGGVGKRKFQRSIVQHPNDYGAKCPSLISIRDCPREPCSKCEVSEWSGWSSCSADCGGGVQSQTREVLNQGEDCPELENLRPCNEQSCSQACVFTDFSSWSRCSKVCGSGRNERKKSRISGDPVACPEPKQFKTCNVKSCPDTISCSDKVDIVFIFDGSGSAGDGNLSFATKFVSSLLDRLAKDEKASVKAGALIFGGGTHDDASGPVDPNTAGSDIDKALGLSIISPIVEKLADVSAAVAKVALPTAGANNLGSALTKGQSLLSASGREEAHSVVILFTDSMVSDPEQAIEAAEEMRKESVSLVVMGFNPFGGFGNMGPGTSGIFPFLDSLASFPSDQNLFSISNRGDPKQLVLNLVALLCPNAVL